MGGDWSGGSFYEELTLLASATAQTINAVGGSLSLPAFDMRNFRSYYLFQNAITTGANAYNPIRANLRWSGFDETAPNVSNLVFREDYEWWAQTGSPAANREAVPVGIDYQQGQCMGGSLGVAWSNQGTTNIALDYALYGSTRPYNRAFNTNSPYDDVLYETPVALAIPAAPATYVVPVQRSAGKITFHGEAGAVQVFFSAQFGSSIGTYFLDGALAGNRVRFDMTWPRRGALISMLSAGAVTTAKLLITTARDRF